MAAELIEIDGTVEEEYREKECDPDSLAVPTLSGVPRKKSYKGSFKAINGEVGRHTLWNALDPKRGYVLKRGQSAVTGKFNHIRIKRSLGGNYVT